MRFFTDYFLRYDSKMERLKLTVSKEEHNFMLEHADTAVDDIGMDTWETQSEMSVSMTQLNQDRARENQL
eukprot:TRINITY_DN3813_c0_g1_i1.p2 TRINITY_DN3813_c0_g1~~TRINITY_DN3813_c0_g1_i1.p2  ORF type:complete len:70 (-),score=11.03 TRINITY_DN3813_c0_g1_i1:216-425(-)